MNELHTSKDRAGSLTSLTDVSHQSLPGSIPVSSKIRHVFYQVYISTAGYKSAGTDKPVYIQIIGDFGNSEFILLDDASPNITESGMHYANPDSIDPSQENYGFPAFSVRDFRFKAEFVGNITNISLRHDPNGYEHSAWRPENILVFSDYLLRAWLFTSSNWLSYEGGNQITLKPAPVVYGGRHSCRRVSQALLTLRSHYAKLSFFDGTNTKRMELCNDLDLKFSHAMKINSDEKSTQKVKFQLQKFTKTNVHMYLFGNTEALGKWNPERAVRMNMIIAPDSIWRGSWNVELEMDNDFGEVKYIYLTMAESESKNSRYIHYGQLHTLDFSVLVSPQNQSEDVIITTNDKYEESSGTEPIALRTGDITFCPKENSHKRQLEESKYLNCHLKQVSPLVEPISERKSPTLARKIDEKEEKNEYEYQEMKILDPSMQNGKKNKKPDGYLQINDSFTNNDAHALVKPQSEDQKYIIEETNELTRNSLRNILSSSDEQLLKSSNDIINHQSELRMLKNNNGALNLSFSHGCKEQFCCNTNPVLHREISLNYERWRTVSVDLSKGFRKELINMQKEVWTSNKILNRYSYLLRASTKEMARAHSRKLRQYLKEKELLENRLAKQFEEKQLLFNKLQDMKGNIRIFCRVRPIIGEGQEDCRVIPGLEPLDEYHGNQNHIEVDGKIFKFQSVLSPLSSQYEVYEKTAGVVRSVLDGYNVCIMAYGQTGSGKSFTMNGEENNKGVNYRALEDLFMAAEERSSQFKTCFYISVLEIYNENLRDLLETKDLQKTLDIRKDTSSVSSGRAVFVQNLTRVEVKNVEDSWKCMEQAIKNRTTKRTKMNKLSSRSHLIYKFYVICEQIKNKVRTSGQLTLVDLAGSERVARSKVSGVQLKEAQSINKSLATLGDVFSSLISRSSHVPFRNSKLTYLLQDSLGGSSKTIMFFNISPKMEDLTETISSLQFSQRVAKVELGMANKNILKKEDTEILKPLQLRETELQSLRSKVAGIENDNKRKTLKLIETEKKLQILEEELKRTRKILERSKQNEKGKSTLFEKKRKEMNLGQPVSPTSSMSKDVLRKHQKERRMAEKNRIVTMKHCDDTKRSVPFPSRCHTSQSEGSSTKNAYSESNHKKNVDSGVSPDCPLTEADQKSGFSNLVRFRSESFVSKLSPEGLSRSLSVDSKRPRPQPTTRDKQIDSVPENIFVEKETRKAQKGIEQSGSANNFPSDGAV